MFMSRSRQYLWSSFDNKNITVLSYVTIEILCRYVARSRLLGRLLLFHDDLRYPSRATQRTCLIETTWVEFQKGSELNAYVESQTVTFLLSPKKKREEQIAK